MLIGISITRATSVEATWTTLSLARAALARGHRVRFVEPWDFEVDDRGSLVARMHAFDSPKTTPEEMARDLNEREAERRYVRLDTLDVFLIRASPFDANVLAFASMVKDQGVPVVNDPAGLLVVTHKGWLASLRDVSTPPTLVTRSMTAAKLFQEKHRRPLVLKPARGSGGRDVHLVKRRDVEELEVAFAAVRATGDHVVVQTYVEEAEEGEKRLVWMDGEVLGGYLRRRAPGEFRHNLAQGGIAETTKISGVDQSVLALLTPHLLRAGVRIAGIDMIGPFVIEVNALNPGGAYHADRLHGTDISGTIVEKLTRSGAFDATRTPPWDHLDP